jgi:Fe-S-cluster containining protein
MEIFNLQFAKVATWAVTPSACSHCGSCCISPNVSVIPSDLEREPRLKPFEFEGRQCISANVERCPFLTEEHLCSIYETRPMVCRKFKPAPWICQSQKLAICKYPARTINIGALLLNMLSHNTTPESTVAYLMLIDPARLPISNEGDVVDRDLLELINKGYILEFNKPNVKVEKIDAAIVDNKFLTFATQKSLKNLKGKLLPLYLPYLDISSVAHLYKLDVCATKFWDYSVSQEERKSIFVPDPEA